MGESLKDIGRREVVRALQWLQKNKILNFKLLQMNCILKKPGLGGSNVTLLAEFR